MRARLLLLIIPLFISLLFADCKKNKISVPNPPFPPSLPGADTPGIPNDLPPDPITYKQVGIHEKIGPNVGGYYEALPPLYDSSQKKYPLLVFLHGGGELGDGSDASLPLLLKNALTRRLSQKSFPTGFSVEENEYSFIIISPQFREWPKVEDVHDVMQHVLGKYRVDSSRIYLSGLSMGGGAAWEYAGSEYGKTLAAIVPICGASWADSAVARQIAKNEVPVWAFHNEDDQAVTINSTKRYARLINAENPPIPVRVTYWPTGGHDAWTMATDPDYREDGKNMYEWMLQYVR